MNSALSVMTDRDFRRLSSYIHEVAGIKMPPSKKTMLEGRLRKRLNNLGMSSFTKYCDYVLSSAGQAEECRRMIDIVTTNKTDFFREPGHFQQLTQMALPRLIRECGLGMERHLHVWSAGCSTGEEPYTLSMVLSEFAEANPGFQFSILATDVSSRVLNTASRGVYPHERIEPVVMELRKKYLLRSVDRSKNLVRMGPELQARVTFQWLNFMDEKFEVAEKMGVIFCRNVLIYFDRPTQEQVLRRICSHLVPGGYLFTGHSETLQGLSLPLTSAGSTIYRKIDR